MEKFSHPSLLVVVHHLIPLLSLPSSRITIICHRIYYYRIHVSDLRFLFPFQQFYIFIYFVLFVLDSVQPQILQFQPQTQPINIPNNMQPNEMINQLNQYQQQQQQQPPHQAATQQPATKLEPKREKKLLQIFNEDGTEVNLAEVAKQKQNSIPNEVCFLICWF